jgi:hypothetical protein
MIFSISGLLQPQHVVVHTLCTICSIDIRANRVADDEKKPLPSSVRIEMNSLDPTHGTNDFSTWFISSLAN